MSPTRRRPSRRSTGALVRSPVVRLAVLASGTGTLLEAMLADGLEIVLVVVDRPCRAAEVAEAAGVPVARVVRDSFGPDFDRPAYTERVVSALQQSEVDLVAIAGFGTVLSERFVDAYPGRVLNTHPSLLPAFPGWRAVEAALEAGAEVTGCTVHVVTAEVDAGPVLAQEAVAVEPGDTVESLHERIKVVERSLYPRTIRDYAKQLVP
jgi:phosphoribosylglycinamide formyltransferase 1